MKLHYRGRDYDKAETQTNVEQVSERGKYRGTETRYQQAIAPATHPNARLKYRGVEF